MTYIPGQSGNPSGRPSARGDLARRVRAEVGGDLALVVRVLLEVAGDPRASHRDRVAACQELLSRGWGRPGRVPGVDAERARSELQRLISTPPTAPTADPLEALRRLAAR